MTNPELVESDDERLARLYPWLRPEMIKALREQGVDPEAYAKRAGRLREDPEGCITQLPVSPEDKARIEQEINEPLFSKKGAG